jgi:hypothetical protein
MPRPSNQQVAAVAAVLARVWDPDGYKAGGALGAYEEWAMGIADMIIHAPPDALVEYLGVLEGQIGVEPSELSDRQRWGAALRDAVRGARA